MIVLCSNGLTSESLLEEIRKCVRNAKKAALVVTADHEYKENNYHVARCAKELSLLGLQVECFDFDTQAAEELLKYDVVEIIGGNPYYLLHSLRINNAQKVLEKIADKKLLIGWSAGALVLGPTIAVIEQFCPEMNFLHLNDLSALNLTDIQVVPHYKKFLGKYEDFEEKCRSYEKKEHCSVIRLSDGEGIIIDDRVSLIRI